jgi:hypothetical protein
MWEKIERGGPGMYRVVVESLTTTLYNIILPKLQWWRWTGIDAPGGTRGHWGWIPKSSLLSGSWDKSWSQATRTLRVLCRDPRNPTKVIGESQIQFMAHTQDPSDFASGDFKAILHDEPPVYPIWEENEARTMRVNGRMALAMTWPSDPAINVDWLFDEMYEPGQPGPAKHKDKIWLNLYTTDNPHLDQSAVASQAEVWSEETKQVRIYGQTIRFSNRIHPLFTDSTKWWCFDCKKPVIAVESKCTTCKSDFIQPYNHVREFDTQQHWPTVCVVDPHPRKPHCFGWYQVDPSDDLWQVLEMEIDADLEEVAEAVHKVEKNMGLNVKMRLMDPNMGASPASALQRNVSWQEEFASVGLQFDLADRSEVGRDRVNTYLRPDPKTLQPRLHVHPRCTATILQMKRFSWADFKVALDRGQKEHPKEKYDDFPALKRYLLNSNPEFGMLQVGAPILQRPMRGSQRRSSATVEHYQKRRGHGHRASL